MLNVTRQERQAILFLSGLMLLGCAINLVTKAGAGAKVLAAMERRIGKVDLNHADSIALASVPGIGPRLAGRILEYREANGSFSDTSELKNIKGISNKKYEKLKSFVFAR